MQSVGWVYHRLICTVLGPGGPSGRGGGRGDAWGRGGGGFSAKRGGSMVGIDRLNVPASDNDPRRLGPDLWGPTFGKRCPEGLGQIALSWAAEGPPVGP